jgi:hypothetical protein
MLPSSVHAWWADICGVLLHYSTNLGPVALGEAPRIHGVCVFYLVLAVYLALLQLCQADIGK